MAQVYIGLSGWSYAAWHGPFYPKGLPRTRELAYAARLFDSLEINGSFYALLRPHTYAAWYEQTPRGFRFAVKGSRFITHNKKLRDAEKPLANFFASGVLCLQEKLGPFVWQLAKTLHFDAGRIEEFLTLLPRDTVAAARLARRHDARVAGRSYTKARVKRGIRHALEVRNETYFTPELARILRRHRVALVVSDAADWPRVEEITAPFVYVRLHGSRKTYGSSYTDAELERWAEKIRRWNAGERPGRGRDVYVYFDNDWHAHAPRDALRLIDMLGLRRARRQTRIGPASLRPFAP